MSQPVRPPSPRVVADRVLNIVRAQLVPEFATALVRNTSANLQLDVTDAETDAVSRELPAAAAGHPLEELDVVVGRLLAQHRSQASAAQTYQDTLAPFGRRTEQGGVGVNPASATSTQGPTAGQPPPSSPFAQYGWPAMPVGGAPFGPAATSVAKHSSGCCEPCAIAGTQLEIPEIDDPAALISGEFVTAAAVLAVVYQYGDRIGFFTAVNQAVQQLDNDELCIEDAGLLNQLYCWDERYNRVKAPERARLVAKVLGLNDPNRPPGVRPDPIVPGLLDTLLDAINTNCDPGYWRNEPTSMDAYRLESAVRAVQVRLSSSMTVLSTLRVRDLQAQFCRALEILRGIAPSVRGLCRPADSGSAQQAVSGQSKEWVSVGALVGARLPDGTDLFDAAATASAWRTVFDWLVCSLESVWTPPEQVCAAAALLRPAGWARYSSRCGPASSSTPPGVEFSTASG